MAEFNHLLRPTAVTHFLHLHNEVRRLQPDEPVALWVVSQMMETPGLISMDNRLILRLLGNLPCPFKYKSPEYLNHKLVCQAAAAFCYSILTESQKAELEESPRMYSELGQCGLVEPDYDCDTEGSRECSSWGWLGMFMKEIYDAEFEQGNTSGVSTPSGSSE